MSYSRLAQIHSEPRGTSSAVASVLFPRGGDGHHVTKPGSYIYYGDASNFHEWEFRTQLRAKAAGKEPEKYAEVMSRIIDGLRGEAFIAAKEVGLNRLWHPGGDAEQAESEESDNTEFVVGEPAGEGEDEIAGEKGKGKFKGVAPRETGTDAENYNFRVEATSRLHGASGQGAQHKGTQGWRHR